MNDEASPTIDPFSPAVLDEATELRALSRALQLARGFKLLFVRCNQADQRRDLIEKLHSEMPSLNIQEIQFKEPIAHLLDALREKTQQPVPDVLFVYGLEYSLPSAADAHLTPLVANLNASRNSFPDGLKLPLVLWVPEYVLRAIMLGAPDFFSIRSGVYFFASNVTETSGLAEALTADNESVLGNLTREEREERVKAIEGLLADYQSLPYDKRDPDSELRLRLRLANTLFSLGSMGVAKVQYQQLLNQAKDLGNRKYENIAIGSLGLIADGEGSWREAESYFERSLETARQIKDRDAEATSLNNLGKIYINQARFEEAEKAFKQTLEIASEMRDRVEEARALTNMGVVLVRQNKLSEAETHFQRSLKIAREIEQKDIESKTLLFLGILYSAEGRFAEAQKRLEEGLEIAAQLGELTDQSLFAYRLSLLHELQGDLKRAIDFIKCSIEVLRKINSKELENAMTRLTDLERKAKEQVEAQQQPA